MPVNGRKASKIIGHSGCEEENQRERGMRNLLRRHMQRSNPAAYGRKETCGQELIAHSFWEMRAPYYLEKIPSRLAMTPGLFEQFTDRDAIPIMVTA
jgi:hypothetical protein